MTLYSIVSDNVYVNIRDSGVIENMNFHSLSGLSTVDAIGNEANVI